MKGLFKNNRKNGSILILTLWILSFLTVFAVQIGLGLQIRLKFLSRLEKRQQLKLLAQSAIHKALAVSKMGLELNSGEPSIEQKTLLFNNPLHFKNMSLLEGQGEVSYLRNNFSSNPIKVFGIVDEERKINVNTMPPDVLKDILKLATGLEEKEAQELANALIDWREYGEGEIVGFFSDDYYENLKFPYQPKKGFFEVPEEILLVKGFDQAIYDRIKEFVTIYGDGHVNINTAPKDVLMAIGVPENLAIKILHARQGPDGIEATTDDFVFRSLYTFLRELEDRITIDPEEKKVLEELLIKDTLKTISYFYQIQGQGILPSSDQRKVITCVFNIIDGKIVYWREN